MSELVEPRTLTGREVVERATVGAGADVARWQAAPARLLLGRPGVPPVAAELAQILQGGRPVDEGAQLADRLAPEARDAALGEDREAVGQREAHRLLDQGDCGRTLPGR